jgi:hypothetical protein
MLNVLVIHFEQGLKLGFAIILILTHKIIELGKIDIV